MPAPAPVVPGIIPPQAMERYEAVRRVEGLAKTRGISVATACREAGVPRASFERWRARMAQGGIEALADNYANCGRRPIAVLDEQELQIARGLYVQTGSATAALRILASRPECREETAEAITKRRRSKHTLTPTLRGQLAAVPQAVRDWHKSPSRVQREQFITPRTLGYLGADGREAPLLPGQLFERDDMSNNFLFWVEWPWGGDPCSDRYGVRLARGQNLLALDAGSLRFLSFELLVRLRDSYRADDIWQWVGSTYRDLGIPEIGERWERGIWTANKLHGIPIEAGHTDTAARIGGIQALGRRIITSQSPTTKIIENRFRYLQRVCTDIPGQIGARRGEMEAVNKLWTACREGRRDPREYFPSYQQVTAALEAKLQWCNSEPVEGALYQGIPNEIWQREGGDQRLTKLAAEQTYLFSRDLRRVTVTKGHALVRRTEPDGRRLGWWFHHDDLWRHEGRKVALYLDDQCAEAGATAVLADGRDLGTVIGHCALVQGCPQFAIGLPDGEDTRGSDALARRRDFTTAVRSEYRALGLRHTVARSSRAASSRGRIDLSSGEGTRGGTGLAPARRNTPADTYDEAAEMAHVEAAEAAMRATGSLIT